MLGFKPVESVVVLALKSRVVEFACRLDVTWFVDDDAGRRQLVAALQRYRGAKLVLLGYSQYPLLVRRSLEELNCLLWDFPIIDVLVTDERRWWSLTCHDSCCPPEGLPYDFAATELATQAVFEGIDMSDDRDAVVKRVAGPDPGQLDHLGDVFVSAMQDVASVPPPERCAHAVSQVDAFKTARRTLTPAEVARLCIELDDADVWPVVLMSLRREDADACVDLFSQLVLGCVPEFATVSVGLLGFAAWLNGGGALMTACAQRLEWLEPSHALFVMLAEILHDGLPPARWEPAKQA